MSGAAAMATVADLKDRPDLRAALDAANEHGDAVRIDRRTRWGNPFVIGRHGSRDEVIERYRTWLWGKIERGEIAPAELAALNGKTLFCHCAPRPCHGDILAKAAAWAREKIAADMTDPTRIEPKERLIQGPVYAGVGARRTPPTVLAGMQDMARELADAGWYLRTGGAAGADNAFARGAPPGQRSVWVPWRGYNGWQSFACTVLREDELGIMRRAAARHHPAWERCPPKVRDLHARNVAVLLGSGMAYPADAVICWTERGRVSGGTGMTIRIARAHGIPVFNLAETEPAQAMRRLEGIAASVTAELARRKAEERSREAGKTASRHEARGGGRGRSMRL